MDTLQLITMRDTTTAKIHASGAKLGVPISGQSQRSERTKL